MSSMSVAGVDLPVADEMKVLGVVLDRRLTFDSHATSVDVDVDVDVEWMYELRQSPLCPPQTYDLHSNDTIKFLVYYSTAQ